MPISGTKAESRESFGILLDGAPLGQPSAKGLEMFNRIDVQVQLLPAIA